MLFRPSHRLGQLAPWPPNGPTSDDDDPLESGHHESLGAIKVTSGDQFRFIHRYTHAPIIRTPPDRVAPSHRSPASAPPQRVAHFALPPGQSPSTRTKHLLHLCNACHARVEDMPEQTNFLRFDAPKERDKNGFNDFTRAWRKMNELASVERSLDPPLRTARRGA